MPALKYFPIDLFREAKWSWDIAGPVIGGGQTASGQQPLMRFDGGGLWKATLGDISLSDTNRRRAWRAIAGFAEGGVQPLIVPMRLMPDSPWPVVGGVELTGYSPVFHDGDVPFAGGIGYHADVIDAQAVGAAAQRATQVTIRLNNGSELLGGEHFSVDDPVWRWRVYRIVSVEAADTAGEFVVNIRPPLRAAMVDGARLVFDSPRCIMRLASSDAMDAVYERPWRARPSVSFVEFFPPFPP